jgi:hypothetical protein
MHATNNQPAVSCRCIYTANTWLLPPQGWRIFNWQAYQVPWDVPWDGKTTAATMAVWTLSFAGTAFLAMPLAYSSIVGMPLYKLSAAGQADFALWSEIVELVVTFAIIGSVAAR